MHRYAVHCPTGFILGDKKEHIFILYRFSTLWWWRSWKSLAQSARSSAATTQTYFARNLLVSIDSGRIELKSFWLSLCMQVPFSILGVVWIIIKTPSYQHRNSHYKDKTIAIFIMKITIPGKTVIILRRAQARLNIKTVFPGMDPIIRIRRSLDNLIL